jgi:hypothetical protein
MSDYYTLSTTVGQAKLAAALASGTPIELTEMAVGDGNGVVYNPVASQTALANEVGRFSLSDLYQDPVNSNWVVAEAVIPADEGGYFIREAGIFDSAGDMIYVIKYPETYKPILSEGSTRDLSIRAVMEMTNADQVTLNIDPNVVIATRNWVTEFVKQFAPHWSRVDVAGTPLALAGTGDFPSLAAMKNSRDVAFIDNTGEELGMYRYDYLAGTYALLGTSLTISGLGHSAITALNATDIALVDYDLATLSLYRFNYTTETWGLIGTPLSIPGVEAPGLAAVNGTDVALSSGGLDQLRMYRFDFTGLTWSLLGTPFDFDGSVLGLGGFNTGRVVAVGNGEVVFLDNNNLKLVLFKFNYGSLTWAVVGTPSAVPAMGFFDITALNKNDIVVAASLWEEVRLFRIDRLALTFAQISGVTLPVPSMGGVAVAAMNGTDISLIDGATEELTHCHFTFSIGHPYALSF